MRSLYDSNSSIYASTKRVKVRKSEIDKVVKDVEDKHGRAGLESLKKAIIKRQEIRHDVHSAVGTQRHRVSPGGAVRV